MNETPSPPASQTSANGLLTGGRTGIALREVLRRLENELPPLLAFENTRLGLSGNAAFRPFTSYGVAPTVPTKGHANNLYASLSVKFEPQGLIGFKRVDTLSLFLIESEWKIDEQMFSAYDRSDLVGKVLHNYLSGCRDAKGRVCWKTLAPQTQGALPQEWSEYAGVQMNYLLLQAAGNDLWTS